MSLVPSPSYSITIRVEIQNFPGQFAKIASKIGKLGGNLGAVDIVSVDRKKIIRDITIDCASVEHSNKIIQKIREMQGVKLISYSDKVFLMHLGGKISIENKIPLKTREALSIAYTPGVARVCNAIAAKKDRVYNLTIKKNTVGIVTDGTAVLGLGDIGPYAALPVMEGKAMLFKEFANVDAFPICLDTKDVEQIVNIVKKISPVFGGINLEDISSPRCFLIEQRLKKELDIPVFHDDQHGTAVVVLAALYNALKIVNKKITKIRVVISGIGAAGIAIAKILKKAGVKNIVGCDTKGAIYQGRKENMNFIKEWFAKHTNKDKEKGDIHKIIKKADVFIGVSSPNILNRKDIENMAKDPIVFAMANPVPEIMPEEIQDIARIIATGRSDYPNQINNVLCFPGIFRGALDCRATDINDAMKIAAAKAIANIISKQELNEEYIIPSVFDKRVVKEVRNAVIKMAYKTKVALRRKIK